MGIFQSKGKKDKEHNFKLSSNATAEHNNPPMVNNLPSPFSTNVEDDGGTNRNSIDRPDQKDCPEKTNSNENNSVNNSSQNHSDSYIFKNTSKNETNVISTENQSNPKENGLPIKTGAALHIEEATSTSSSPPSDQTPSTSMVITSNIKGEKSIPLIKKRENSGTRNAKLSCKYCDKRYCRKGKLRRHLAFRHPKCGTELTLTCDKCGEAFYQKSAFKAHKRIHRGLLPYPCKEPNCSMEFTLKKELKQHKKSVHASN